MPSFLWDCKFSQTCNLACMHSFFLAIQQSFLSMWNNLCMSMCVYLHIYELHMITTPCFTVQLFSAVWKGVEWWEECRGKAKEGEDKHILRALFYLILYQLSSLGPSEKLNHKRTQSLGEILFSPSWIHYITTQTHTISPSLAYTVTLACYSSEHGFIFQFSVCD